MIALGLIFIVLGMASLAFGFWIWIDPNPVRKNPDYDDARKRGWMPGVRMVTSYLTMGVVLVVVGGVIIRGY